MNLPDKRGVGIVVPALKPVYDLMGGELQRAPNKWDSQRLTRAILWLLAAILVGYGMAVLRCNCGLPSLHGTYHALTSWNGLQYTVLLPLSVMLVELPFVGWRKSSAGIVAAAGPSVISDLFYWFIQFVGIQEAMILAGLATAYSFLHDYTSAYSLKLAHVSSPVVKVAIIFLATDFLAYWVHRWMHGSRLMWEAHKVHHSAVEFNVLLAFRFHPLERVAWDMTNIVLALLLGADMGAYVVFITIYSFLGQLQHARVDWTFGPLGKIFVSPVFHRFHHAIAREDHDKNFGARLVIFDMLFGTYSTKVIPLDAVGVEDNTYVKNSVFTEFFRPLYVFFSNAMSMATQALARVPRRGVATYQQSSD